MPEKPEPPDPDGPGGGASSHPGNIPATESGSDAEAPALTAADVPAIADALAGSAISAAEVDAVLRDGGNRRNSVLRVAAYFMKDKPLAEDADFLRREYVARHRDVQPGGKGFQFGNDKLAVWFDEGGITLARGDSAWRASRPVHLTWEQAAVRIREMLGYGAYISGDMLDEATSNEHWELAGRILHSYWDDLRDFRELPDEWQAENGGWPDDIRHMEALLGNPEEYSNILARMEEDFAALRTDPGAPTRFYNNPYRLLQDVRDAGIQPLEFPHIDLQPAPFLRFITQDEIDAFLAGGSSFHSGKYRILSYFLHDHTPKERASFLKKEYGQAGRSHALGGADDSWSDCAPGKGIELKRGGIGDKAYDTVKVTWSAAEKRIMKLIREGRYVPQAGLDGVRGYERDVLARTTLNFYHNIPEQRPYPAEKDYQTSEDVETVEAMLDDPEQVGILIESMRPILEATPEDDRYYTTRSTGYENLLAFRDGTFDLFPGLDMLPPPVAAITRHNKPVEQAPEQLSLFSQEPPSLPAPAQPVLRGVEEQQARIEQAIQRTVQEPEPTVTGIISQDEIDTLLVGAVETPEQFDAILTAFTQNPRSREAAQLVKDAYSGAAYTTSRIDGAEGYMGLAGDATGVTLSKSGPQAGSEEEQEPPVTLGLAWHALHRRVAELAAAGRYVFQHDAEPTPDTEPLAAQEHAVPAPDLDNTTAAAPQPVFFADWETARPDFDLDRYGDGDVVGYNKDGVEYAVGRSGSLAYVTGTGMVWGGNSVPGNIYEQIRAYLDGSLTDAQVRENYLKVLAAAATEPQAAPEQDANTPEASESNPPMPEPAAESPGDVTLEVAGPLVSARVLQDPDYIEDLMKAKTRVSLRNPVGWAVEQSIRDREQQEPELYHKYFFDPVFRDALFDFVLKDTYAKREELRAAADLDTADHDDLIDVLENGLLAPEHKEAISGLLRGGAANTQVVRYLADTFSGEAEAMTLETGEAADYFTNPQGISIEIADSHGTKRNYSWEDTASILRAVDARGWRQATIAAEPENVAGPVEPMPLQAEAQPGRAVEPEPDFDTAARTALERVMADTDYLAELAKAPSRAFLRNPCTRALEQSIRDHEQDEPARFHKYFYDDDWNSRLFDYVLRESYALRPLPEREPEPGAEVEDDFSDIDVAAIRERLQNPTPEDEARLADMLDFAEQAAAEFDAAIGMEQEPDAGQDDISILARDIAALFEGTEWRGSLDGVNDGFELVGEIEAQLRAGNTGPAIEMLQSISGFRTHDEDLETQAGIFISRLREMNRPVPETAIDTEQDAIDTALREWNGNVDSKALVYQYMREHGRERDTAAFLQAEFAEYAGNAEDNSVFHAALPDGTPRHLPWPKAQRRIAQLIEQGVFLTPEELAYVEREYDFEGADAPGYDSPAPSETRDGLDLLDPEDVEEPVWRETGDGETARVMFDLMPDGAEDVPAAEPVAASPPDEGHLPPARNYRITEDSLGAGGPKTRFAANIAAIRTLKQIEDEGRAATLPEQEVLARYVGWGGLADAFDDGIENWQKEYAELKGLLAPDEYDKARASVLNAHYTPPVVVRAIYDAIGQMGFKRGNVLEPSCGIGHFFGLVPEEMRGAKLYGVEVDDLSARIAEKLYPSANIINKGFEKTNFPDSFFDVVVGNVPFGDYKAYDQDYNRHNFFIHDYFIAKSIDKARAGGIVALVTSNGASGGTFDKRDSKARRYMAERCDLIGAIRLPDNTFKAAAGTDMTTDILFLQKREVPRSLATDMPDWVGVDIVHEHQHEYGTGEIRNNVLTLNNYYREHPEMVLGNLEVESGPFGPQLSCKPRQGEALADQLREAVSRLQADITVAEPELDDLADSAAEGVPADPRVKNFSYALVTLEQENGEWYAGKIGEGEVYYRENSRMYPVELPAATLERIRGMVELRDCVHRLIDLQLEDFPDAAIEEQQKRLGALYDAFTAEYGLINSMGNSRAFSSDNAYYLLCSLEILDEDGKLERKADMFTKRTIKQKQVITSVDTASEALAVSIGERARVDMDFMRELTGFSEIKLLEDLRGVIFRDYHGFPDGKYTYRTADEFLSGNVREKLAHYKRGLGYTTENHPQYPFIRDCAEALEQALPKDLEASEIAVRLGSTWVDKEYVQQFMYELLQSPRNIQNACKINYSSYTGEWQVTGKNRIPMSNIAANMTYGTGRRNAYEIIEDTLNLRDVRVYDTIMEQGKEKRVLNKKETTLAQQKQEQIKRAFKDWIWNDPQRRQQLTRKYNDLFNAARPREYDGSHIVFSGMNPEYTMRGYQRDAIARILYGGNTLLAHEVGAGKTFEMVAAAMEGKRLGLCSKSLFAVPNHIIDQIASDFLRLYPSANILVAQKKDFEMRNRKKFCAKIATGDYDAVIIGHSQLEKIPISHERQEQLLQEQLWEVLEGIDEAKRSRGERFTVKQLERTKKRLEARLEKIREGKRRDDVVTFEQLGVDRLFIDEAHNYKNLFLYTKMRNVAGLSTTEAQKSNDLLLKCRYMDELTGGKGVIFATGTPVSNSMTELYTMQRYLQYENLERKNLIHFDSWASTFGETVTAMELAPEGTGYRARTRFSRFHNLPELMAMFSETADIKTAAMLDLVRPEAHFETVVVKPSELQQEMVQSLSERAAKVHSGQVDPKVDNMLKITSDGRKIGLDQRLVNPMLPDFEGSKVNACLDGVHRVWADTKTDRLAQLVFCDFSTPNKDGRFNVYDDIKQKLVAKGVPENEVAFIHDANTDQKKKELFAKVRKGQVRVLFGSTFKMGAGTNVQDKLIAMHDLDCPWRPADLEQRAGRIVRFGNQNPDVYIYRYVTEGTFDAYLWQTVENKQKFISQIMTSKSPVRSCEDVDETALSYAEIKALCSGNPLIKEKIDLDIEVSRLRLLKSEHQSQHHRLEDDLLEAFPKNIKAAEENIAGLEKDTARLADNTPKAPPAPAEPVAEEGEAAAESGDKHQAAKAPFPPMTVLGTVYTEKAAAGEALLEATKSVKDAEPVPVGSYLGFDLSVSFSAIAKKYRLTLKGDMSYTVDMGVDPFGNITRMNNELRVEMPQRLASNRSYLENLHQQVEAAKVELTKPFEMEQELAEKEMRLALVNAELDIDDGSTPMEAAAALGEVESAKQKPSILDGLRTRRETGKHTPRQDKAGAEHFM